MITHETISVDTSDAEVIRVNYVQIDNGIDMGGKLVFDRSNVAYVAQQVEAACESNYVATEAQQGKDHLRIYQSGSDQQSIVNVLCKRDPAGPHGGLSGLMMTIEYAKKLVALLRAVKN